MPAFHDRQHGAFVGLGEVRQRRSSSVIGHMSAFGVPTGALRSVWKTEPRMRPRGSRGSRRAELSECLHANRGEQIVSRTQLHTRIHPSMLLTQPLPVQQMSATDLGTEARVIQAVDRFGVRGLGRLALA
jgi:hypothetical protein